MLFALASKPQLAQEEDQRKRPDPFFPLLTWQKEGLGNVLYFYRVSQRDVPAPQNEAIFSPECQKESQLTAKRGQVSFLGLPLGRVETTRDTAICCHGRKNASITFFISSDWAEKRGQVSFFGLPRGQVETITDTAICWHGGNWASGTVQFCRLKQCQVPLPRNEAVFSPEYQKESQRHSERLNNAFVAH